MRDYAIINNYRCHAIVFATKDIPVDDQKYGRNAEVIHTLRLNASILSPFFITLFIR